VVSLALGAAHMGVVLANGAGAQTWGLNTHGQLGHSVGPKTKYVTKPAEPDLKEVLLEGEKASSIAAGPNCTFLLTDKGRVVSWGSAENGLLGVPVRTNLGAPCCVEALHGVYVSQIKCSRKEVLAFVPQVVTQISPSCAMLNGSTQLVLHGHGFPAAAEECVVKFVLGQEEQTVGASYEGQHGAVHCEAPTMGAAGVTTVTVSFDGAPFSAALDSSQLRFSEEPTWETITPIMGPTTGDTEVTIDVQNFYANDALAARFFGASGCEEAVLKVLSPTQIMCTAPAWAEAEACHIEIALNGQDYCRVPIPFTYYQPPIVSVMTPQCMPHDVPTTVSFVGQNLFDPPAEGLIKVRFCADGLEKLYDGKFRIVGQQQEILCEVPSFTGKAICEVAISLNGGQDYSPVPQIFTSYEPIPAVRSVPSCGPMDGGTTISVVGAGIFDSGAPLVRLKDENREIFCEGTFAARPDGKGSITFVTPVWRDPPATPTPTEGDPPADPEEPPPDSTPVEISLALNRKNFQRLAKPFTFYEGPTSITSITPNTATVGEDCKFVLAGEKLFVSEDMTVMLEWPPSEADDADTTPQPTQQVLPVKLLPPEEEGAEPQLIFTVPGAIPGEASVQVGVNGQQYMATELKIVFSAAS